MLPEIGRLPDDVRKAYTDKLNAFVAMVSIYLPDPGSPSAMSTARAMFGLCLGSLQLARAVLDPVLSRQILDDAVNAALVLIGVDDVKA
jgi:TetR/AcrR family transcriptional repressor of nem operon